MEDVSVHACYRNAAGGVNETGDVLAELKRRVYLAAMALVVLASTLGYVTDELGGLGISPLRLLYGPSAGIIAAGMFVLLWRRTLSLRLTEWILFCAAAAFLLLHMGTALYLRIDTSLASSTPSVQFQFTAFAPWSAAVILLGFVMLDTRHAVRGAFALYLIMVLMVTVYIGAVGSADISRFEVNSLLQQFVLANAFYIVLLYVMARVKEEYGRAEFQRQAMSRLAHTDELTGLPNRRHVLEAGQKEVERLARHARPFSVVLFDIDHFKHINDTHGHPVGDQVLQRVAEVIEEELRAGDEVGRFGGEEFIVLAFDTESDTAAALAERLRDALDADESPLPHVTASFGVASHRAGDNLDALVERADKALYQAKQGGRNRVVVDGSQRRLRAADAQ